MSKKIIAFSFAILLLPLVASAAEGVAVYDLPFLPESVEVFLEFANLLIALLAATFAVKLAALSQGGELEKTWNGLAIAATLFAVLEIYGALQGLSLLDISGFGDVLETMVLLTLLVVFYRTRKSLLNKIMGK